MTRERLRAPAVATFRLRQALEETPADPEKFAASSLRPSVSSPARTRKLYKPTFFDRHGPDGAHRLIFAGHAIFVGMCGVALAFVVASKFQLHGPLGLAIVVLGGPAFGLASAWAGYHFGEAVGDSWNAIAVDGVSTPYREQFSYQHALVMQGRLDEALESFETIIAEQPLAADARIRAAELYARDKRDAGRAAVLFREVQRIESGTNGEFIYATNRLVDLYTGPLAEPGRALVELRRLIERFPGTPTAEHARGALGRLKEQTNAGP